MDRALDLENVLAGEKNSRAMGVDADDGFAVAIGRRVAEEGKHFGLAGLVSRAAVHRIVPI
jgi:hypothetical protein